MASSHLHLVDLSEADNVTVRIIPFALEGFAGAASAMAYAGGAVPKLDTVVRDAPHRTALVDCEAHLGAFRSIFRKVEAASLDPGGSRELIHRFATEPGDGNSCVEIANDSFQVAIRDTKARARGALTFPAGVFRTFVSALKGATMPPGRPRRSIRVMSTQPCAHCWGGQWLCGGVGCCW